MRGPHHARAVTAGALGVGLALVMSACSATGGQATGGHSTAHERATKGTLSASVKMSSGPTTTTIRLTRDVTVEVLSEKNEVVARRRPGPHGTFRVRVAPGRYRLAVSGVQGCASPARVRSKKLTVALLDCTLVAALSSSVAFPTLPLTGPITTGADAMKRLARHAPGSTRIAAAKSTWKYYLDITGTTANLPLTQTLTVWVACASGGTYTSFAGISGYSSTCSVYAEQTGKLLTTTDGHGWPTWFTKLGIFYD